MSIAIMAAVWEHSKQSGSALLLLLALADFANDEGFCWPSIDTLANKARVSRRTVQDKLRQLEQDGEIEVEESGGPKGTNMYRVTPPVGGAKSAPPQSGGKGGANSRKGGVQTSDAILHPNRNEPSIEQPSEEPSLKDSSAKADKRLTAEKRKKKIDTVAMRFQRLTGIKAPIGQKNGRVTGKWWIPITQLLSAVDWDEQTACKVLDDAWEEADRGRKFDVYFPISLQGAWGKILADSRKTGNGKYSDRQVRMILMKRDQLNQPLSEFEQKVLEEVGR